MKITFRILALLSLVVACGYAGSENISGASIAVICMALFAFLGQLFAPCQAHVIYARDEAEAGKIYAQHGAGENPEIATDEQGNLQSMRFNGYLLFVDSRRSALENNYCYIYHLLVITGLKNQK